LRAADAIGQPAAERPHQRCEHHEARGAETRIARRQAELRSQQCRQVDREGDESTERQEVKRAEPPCDRFFAQHSHHCRKPGGSRRDRIARERKEDDRPREQQHAGAAKHRLPAK
jgi:hypothetical protein